MAGFKMKVTPEIENLTEVCKEHSSLDLSLYQKYDVCLLYTSDAADD